MKDNGNGNQQSAHAGDTRIALVLDRSGSMASIREQAREAFNEAVDRVVDEARKGSGEVTLSLITFNEDIQDVLVNRPADHLRKLGAEDYRPGGMTALFDAVGHGIDLLEKPGELGEDDGALVVVVSDGHENASRETTHKDLVERMQALQSTEQWTFSFLCANVDITDLSETLGIQAGNAADWKADRAGIDKAKRQLSNSMASYMADRRSGIKSKPDFWQDEDNSGR